jgi:hypothetical protein
LNEARDDRASDEQQDFGCHSGLPRIEPAARRCS